MDMKTFTIIMPADADSAEVTDYLWDVCTEYGHGDKRGKRCGQGYSWRVDGQG